MFLTVSFGSQDPLHVFFCFEFCHFNPFRSEGESVILVAVPKFIAAAAIAVVMTRSCLSKSVGLAK